MIKYLVSALTVVQLTSCMVYDDYGYYGPTYSQRCERTVSYGYGSSTPYSYRASYYGYNSLRPTRNVIPLDGNPPPGVRGNIFRGGDGMLYMETRN